MDEQWGQLMVWTPIAVAVIVFAPFLILKAGAWWKADQNPVTHRVLLLLGATAVLALGVSTVVRATGMQQFAAFGLTKRLLLPTIYGVFFILLLVLGRKTRPVRTPVWWWILLAALLASGLIEILVPRQRIGLVDIAQSLLLCAGALIVAAAGMWCADWSPRDISVFLYFFGGVALAQETSGLSATPFDVLSAPVGFALIYWAFRGARNRVFPLVLGAVIVAFVVQSIIGDPSASIARIAGVVACALLLVMLVLPRLLRTVAMAVVLVWAVALGIQQGLWRMLIGEALPQWDVTLAHRAYESKVVIDALWENPVTLLFGLGPGGTVNLQFSPDARTLASSGRDLQAVDDVHLLSSWLILKFGVLGLVWLVFLFVAVLRQLTRIVAAKERSSVDVVFLMFVVAGALAALPAATYLFSNPLFAFALGVLVARDPRYRRTATLPPGGDVLAKEVVGESDPARDSAGQR